MIDTFIFTTTRSYTTEIRRSLYWNAKKIINKYKRLTWRSPSQKQLLNSKFVSRYGSSKWPPIMNFFTHTHPIQNKHLQHKTSITIYSYTVLSKVSVFEFMYMHMHMYMYMTLPARLYPVGGNYKKISVGLSSLEKRSHFFALTKKIVSFVSYQLFFLFAP